MATLLEDQVKRLAATLAAQIWIPDRVAEFYHISIKRVETMVTGEWKCYFDEPDTDTEDWCYVTLDGRRLIADAVSPDVQIECLLEDDTVMD